jgi:hypothetical protein
MSSIIVLLCQGFVFEITNETQLDAGFGIFLFVMLMSCIFLQVKKLFNHRQRLRKFVSLPLGMTYEGVVPAETLHQVYLLFSENELAQRGEMEISNRMVAKASSSKLNHISTEYQNIQNAIFSQR